MSIWMAVEFQGSYYPKVLPFQRKEPSHFLVATHIPDPNLKATLILDPIFSLPCNKQSLAGKGFIKGSEI